MFEKLRRSLRERTTREALADQFQKLGLDFASFDPIIRATMEREAIESGDVRRQIERFLMVARMADQHDLSDAQKKYAIAEAYRRHAASLAPDVTDVEEG